MKTFLLDIIQDLSNLRHQELWQGRIVLLIEALAVVFFSAVLISQFYGFTYTWFNSSAQNSSKETRVLDRNPGINKNMGIAQYHLFGEYKQNLVSMEKGDLELRGIFFGHNNKADTAVIALVGQPEEIYRAGDTLPDGGVVYQIFNDHVSVLQGGILKTYDLKFENTNAANNNNTPNNNSNYNFTYPTTLPKIYPNSNIATPIKFRRGMD